MAPSKNKKGKAAANKKEEKKSSADDPPSEAFHAAMAEYYAQRDWFNQYKTQFWASIPESPPNECPKIPLEKPWWDKEHDAKWEKQFPGLLERREKDGVEGLTKAFREQMKVQEEKEEEEKAEKKKIKEEKQKEREAAAAAGKGKKKEVQGQEFADDDFRIVDVDGLIRRLTGQWELNVPQAFKFPK